MNQNTDLAQFDELRAELALLVSPIKTLTVTSIETRDSALDAGKKISGLLNAIEKRRKELTQPLVDRKREIDAYCASIVDPVQAAKDKIKNTVTTFELAAERERQEIIRKQREEAEAKERAIAEARRKEEAEAEKKRKAEERRIAAEQKAQREAEEAAQREAEAMFGKQDAEETLRAAQAERDRLAADKQAKADREAQAAKDREIARAAADREAEQRAADLRAQEKAIEAQRTKNIRTKPSWTVVDASLIPREYLMIDEVCINRAVNKEGVREIPGLSIVEVRELALGASR